MFNRNKKPQVKARTSNNHIDYSLLILVIVFSICGALMIYSGSVIVAVKQGFPGYYYFLRELLWIAIGLLAGFIMFRVDYHTIAKFSFPALLVSLGLMLLVLFVDRDQAIKRWIPLGFFDLQPSELLKLTFIIYLASWLAKFREKRDVVKKEIWHHIKFELVPFLLLLALVCGLILIQPDLDTTIMLGTTSFIIYLLAGTDVIHQVGAYATAGVSSLLVFIMMFTAKYRMTRVQTWWDFWKNNSISDPFGSGYQFRQILVAVASGGWLGVGFAQSKQKYLYLGDTAFSDTIFAIIAEEFGLLGGVIVVSMFIYLFLKGLQIARRAPDKLGFLLASGISIWITLQAFLHIAANVALIPINGNTLPFFSYGGSSTIINLMAIGLLLNVARFGGKGKKLKPEELARESANRARHKR